MTHFTFLLLLFLPACSIFSRQLLFPQMVLLRWRSFPIKKKQQTLVNISATFLQPDQIPLALFQRALLGTVRMSSAAGPAL